MQYWQTDKNAVKTKTVPHFFGNTVIETFFLFLSAVYIEPNIDIADVCEH